MTLKLKTGKVVAVAATGMNPESTPPAIAAQGLAKVLWVRVWFLGWNSKVTISPTAAVTWFGEKVKPEAPTTTLWVVWAKTAGTATRAATAVANLEKNIFSG